MFNNAVAMEISTSYTFDRSDVLWLVEIEYCDFIGLEKCRRSKLPSHQRTTEHRKAWRNLNGLGLKILKKLKFISPRDGINGMVQGCMVPGLSGILVIGQKTREVFRGGDSSNKINYDTVPVPELKIITPLNSANAFSRVLQQCFRQSSF